MSPDERRFREWLSATLARSELSDRIYEVGGGVRDSLLGIPTHDIDLTVEVEGGAERVARFLSDAAGDRATAPHHLGAGYPIWQVDFRGDFEGFEVQIADTQAEMFPDPATRARIARFGTLEEDCLRRDFTVNMLYRRIATGDVVDPSGAGLDDLKSGVLRGHPRASLDKIFADDPLRMLRLARFHARYGWKIDSEARAAVGRNAARVSILSAERVRGELEKIIEKGRLEVALEVLRETKLLDPLFPELLPMIGCTQDRHYHSEGDVWVHTLAVIANAPRTLPLQLAALLHDTGKPVTRSEDGTRVKFLGHETVSTDVTRSFLERLKFSKSLIDRVTTLVKLHLRGGDATQWVSARPARKLMRDAGDALPELLQLIEADSRASRGPDGEPRLEHLPILHARLEEAAQIPVRRKPVLDGRDVMACLNLKGGPEVGRAMEWLQELEDDEASSGRVLTPEEARRRLQADFRIRS